MAEALEIAHDPEGGEERIGRLELTDLFLEPLFRYSEPRTGEFEPGASFLTARWLRDESLSATITIGAAELLGLPRRYAGSTAADGEIALLEAYVEGRGALGRIRLGRVPLPFGLEAGVHEARLRPPRSLAFRGGWVGLRDLGLGFQVGHAGFSSEWAVHNGEGGQDVDNQMWFTSRWRWRGSRGLALGFSASTGRTTPQSTAAAAGQPARTFAEAGLQPDEDARLRIGNVFAETRRGSMGAGLQYTVGEALQVSGRSKFRAAHADLDFAVTPRWSLLTRFERLDPSDRHPGDVVEEVSAGVALNGLYRTSVVYLIATAVFEEGSPDRRHEGLLVWRLTPLSSGGVRTTKP